MVAKEWFSRQSLQWTERHSRGVLSSLNMHVYPDLGEMPISSILKQDLISTLRKLEAEGKYETCYRIRQKIEAIFSYAEIEGHCSGNPAIGLQQILIKPQPKNHASLPISELPVFLKKIVDDSGAFPTTKLAMMFMIHVFVRTNSLRHAMWNDFNLECDEPLWIVPDYDMKNKIEFHVPLSSQSVKILEEMKKFSGPNGFVFPQVRYPQKAMSNNTLLYFSNRLGYAGRSTTHGFRKVASTSLHDSGLWSYEVVEKQMSHLVGTKVSRAYNRAEHLNERRKMMQWWSNYIDSLLV
jgi:integrase